MNRFIIALLLCSALAPALSAESRPNILLIVVDDMGFSDLGCTGSEIETPNIDRLADEGLLFTQFTNDAKCETTRRSLMSGRYNRESKSGKSTITIPENLKLGGYQNFMVGKWHIYNTPQERGFDRFFGFLEGATGHLFDEGGGDGADSYTFDGKPFEIYKGFYSTNAFTDCMIKFIQERDKQKPFFSYLAYNAPHYPLQAPKEAVMKYRGKYLAGWEALRESRFARQKELGLFPDNTQLPPFEEDLRKWDSLSGEEKDDMDLRMATFAAMVDIVDQNIGRLVTFLKEEGLYENTLILFLSDNGACPFDRTRESTLANNYMPWDSRSYYCYNMEWAHAGNTPLKKYKQDQFEGGVTTPLIAHWPKGITVPGTRNDQRGHLVDFHATFRELAGVDYPKSYEGRRIAQHARGISLVPSFSGKTRPEHPYLYYDFYGKKTALVTGEWKLVNEEHLYHLTEDRLEQNDLAKKNPNKFKEMIKKWNEVDAKIRSGR